MMCLMSEIRAYINTLDIIKYDMLSVNLCCLNQCITYGRIAKSVELDNISSIWYVVRSIQGRGGAIKLPLGL